MKKIIGIILILIIAAVVYGLYLYNKPVSGTKDQKPAYILSATELFSEFETNEMEANDKYLDQVILVTGVVTDVSGSNPVELSVVLASGSEMFGVSCSLLESEQGKVKKVNVGDEIKVKGYCSGMLMDVVLNRCVIIE